ncbi:hypothetical protein [Cellulomonas sp. URHE0023]|uniref:hypothetical protein n=1 Tax=Cellulomonas sp. URHE0023 TaxID=1380354 RepID=UPI00068E7006|nr:hypothetical protein [Cellulomonas sp. URHE0023]
MRFSWVPVAKTVLTVAAGIVVGVMGTTMHRSVQPWGLVLSLLLVLAAGATARAFGGLGTWIGFLVGLGLTVLVLSQEGPGGDILIPSEQKLGLVWIFGSLGVAVAAMLLPRSWFSDTPRPARTPQLPDVPVGEPDAHR